MAIQKYRTNQRLLDSAFNQTSGGTLTLSGNTILASTGTFQYAIDKSSTYIARSVVDAEYVTGLTSAISNIGTIGEVIYRGVDKISGATDFIYSTSGVTMSNLCISETPVTDVDNYYFLTWNSGTSKVNKVNIAGLQCAYNGLSLIGTDVILGGSLTTDTTISGGTYDFCINNENANIVIDNRCNGGVYLKSQSGLESYFNTFTNTVGIKIDYNDGFKIYDNRVDTCQVGIEYDANYANYYSARSLVDKNYVDTVAAGLTNPIPAVLAATTENISLTGLTGVTIIDGVEITVPISITDNRILVKDQTDAKYNGIYVLTGGTSGGTGTTFVRSYDFDESTESVQGAYTFVTSGDTNNNTSWILTTENPILIDVTALEFVLFNESIDIVAGHGINDSINYKEHTLSVDGEALAGNSIIWSGTTGSSTYNVDISGGTLGTILTEIKDDIVESSNIVNVCNVIANYSATTTSDFIGVSGATVIYLPSNPKACQRIIVTDIGSTALCSNISIYGTGSLDCINGCADPAIINTNFGSITFINNGIFWSAVGFIN